MNSKKTGIIVTLSIVILFITFFVVLGLSIVSKDADTDFIQIISGLSSFFVAILTSIYVYTTSKQIDVANAQLEEMKQERAMHEQPLLAIAKYQFEIERPNFFYTPPTDEYSFLSKYKFSASIQNCSNFSAIAVDIDVVVEIPGKETYYILKTVTKRINIIEPQAEKTFSLDFVGDKTTKLFSALREPHASLLPQIAIIITYKNLCGGFFKTESKMHVIPTDENYQVQILWHSRINSVYIEEAERIEQLQNSAHDEKWEKIFNDIKLKFDSSLGGQDSLLLKCLEIPESFSLTVLTKEEYEAEVKEHHFPHYVHKSPDCITRIRTREKISV